MDIEGVLLLVVLGMANHQVAHVITTSVLFQGLRQWVARAFGQDSKAAYLVGCHLCAGTWVGLFQGVGAVIYGFSVFDGSVVDALIVGFAVAMIGRVFNEVLALAAARVESVKLANQAEEIGLYGRRVFPMVVAEPDKSSVAVA